MEILNFMTGGFGVNTLIVPLEDNKVVVVDPGGDIPTISQFMASRELEPVAIVCTHGHFDHIIGMQDLLDACGSLPVAIHPGDSCYLGSDANTCREAHGFDLGMLGLPQLTEAMAHMPSPTCLLEEGDTLAKIPGIPCPEAAGQWRVLHTPGHSQGSICLYHQQEGHLICGDTLFYGGYGRADLFNSNQAKLIASLRRLMQELPKETLIYPGHGEVRVPLGESL